MRPTFSVLLIASIALISCSPMLPGIADATPQPDRATDADQAAVIPDDIQTDDILPDDSASNDDQSDNNAAETDSATDTDHFITLERTTVQWGTPADDYIAGLAVDGAGAIYVAGSTDGTLPDCMNAGNYDAFVSKLAPDLSLSWTRELGTAGYDYGYALYVADGGLVYAGGNTWGAFEGFEHAGEYDRFLAAWQPDGTPVWLSQWGTATSDSVAKIRSDGNGNLLLLEGVGVAKHAVDGTELWNSGELQPFTGFGGITVAPDGTIILSGSSGYPATYDRLPHCVIHALDTDGNFRWATSLNEGGEYCAASAVSPTGDIYVAGTIQESDIFLLKLNAAGERQWLVRIETPDEDRGGSLLFDRNGYLYLLGATKRVPPDKPATVENDLLLVKFTPDGVPVWMSQWGSEWDDGAAGMAFDPQGRLIVAGHTAKEIDGNISAGGVDMFISVITLPE